MENALYQVMDPLPQFLSRKIREINPFTLFAILFNKENIIAG